MRQQLLSLSMDGLHQERVAPHHGTSSSAAWLRNDAGSFQAAAELLEQLAGIADIHCQ